MKFLADESFPGAALRALRRRGDDVAWMSEGDAGATDEAVLARSIREQRILLTLDKDFGELVFQQGLPAECGVILFRVDAESPSEFSDIVLAALQARDDWSGFFTVVSRDRVRMRPLPKS
jgi:predicted nuclease of predicted toxin-antitoxin system